MKRTLTAVVSTCFVTLILATQSSGAPTVFLLGELMNGNLEAPALPTSSPVSEEQNRRSEQDKRSEDLPERDEIRRSVQLSPDASVKVSGINGPVTIETSNTSQAEIYIVRSARNRSDLEQRKIIIEQSATSLVVRGEKDEERSGDRDVQVRHRVTLKLPRQISLEVSGVNGRVGVGEVEGPVRVSGVNGSVEVAQARGYSELSGINGKVTLTIRQLGERGIKASGINGSVDLRFTDDVNADLSVSGINGNVTPDLPNVTIEGEVRRSNFRARIGSGGSPIRMSGINGQIRLSRAG